jgi:hypothetical protein
VVYTTWNITGTAHKEEKPDEMLQKNNTRNSSYNKN